MSTPTTDRIAPRRRRHRTSLAVATGALGLLLAACGTGKTAGSQAEVNGQTTTKGSAGSLTVVEQAPPSSVNPARINNGGGGAQYAELAYDPLIYLAPSGKYEPDLATSWGYVGTGNREFVLHLRSNVQFSDGSTMTATDVVNSINYAKSGSTTASSYLGALKTAKATGPLTVTLTFDQPQPDLETVFDQNEMAGDIIGPKLLATPSLLGTETDGAGPYELSKTDTVTGSSYVYVQNPHYWNKSLDRFKKYTLRVIASTASALDALQTGQADFMAGDPTQATAAKKDGLDVYAAPGGFTALWLPDFQGTIAKPLANLQVRQALAYATDRPALAKAIFSSYAQPTDEISSPGYTGYIPGSWNTYYTYNVAKAKALLKEAGYPHGFTLTLPAFNGQDEEQETEAIASEFSQIGVTVKIQEVPSFTEWVTAFLSKKYPGGILEYGTLPASIEASEIFAAHATFNVFNNPLPAILSDVNKANQLDGTAANTEYQAAMKLWIEGAYADVLFDNDGVSFARPASIANVDIGTQYPGSDLSPDLAFWEPASK